MNKWYGMVLSLAACGGFACAEGLLDQVVLEPFAKRYSTPEGTVLEITAPKPADDKWGNYQQAIRLDTKPYVGKRVMVECEISAEGVTRNTRMKYFGVKYMLSNTSDGVTLNTEGNVVTEGTYEWKWSSLILDIPQVNFDEVRVVVGLQQAYGKVRYRNLKMSEAPAFKLEIPEGYKCEYTDAARKIPPLRGVMSPGHNKELRHVNMTEKDIRDLATWGANVVRWQYIPSEKGNPEIKDPKRYGDLLDDDLKYLDSLLPVFKECGIYVIYDMHTVPGGRMRDNIAHPGSTDLVKFGLGSGSFHLFYNTEFLNCYLEQWRRIARHFKGEPQVVGYDLMNEPVQRSVATYELVQVQLLASQEISKIDPDKLIFFESNNAASSEAYRTQLPLPVKNVVYQVHMYTPSGFTHQGVNDSARFKADGTPITYPGVVGKKYFDREELRKELASVRKFQQQYGARIYIGEFSAIRWAVGADKYLEDCISIFEEYGWDWTYHAFREWQGWSVEHTENFDEIKRAPYETTRKRALVNGFRNIRK